MDILKERANSGMMKVMKLILSWVSLSRARRLGRGKRTQSNYHGWEPPERGGVLLTRGCSLLMGNLPKGEADEKRKRPSSAMLGRLRRYEFAVVFAVRGRRREHRRGSGGVALPSLSAEGFAGVVV